MESFCVWMVFLLCSPNPLISLWKCKISINKLSIYLLWISYESTDSCRNHSLSTHLGARTSTMSCLMWNTNWPNLSSDKQGNQKCFNLKSRAFCRVSKFSTALANSMYGCTGIFKNTMSDYALSSENDCSTFLLLCLLPPIWKVSYGHGVSSSAEHTCCKFFLQTCCSLCFTPLRPKFNPRPYVWKGSSVTCCRSVVSSGYSGFLHQKTAFIIISPPWYDPGCCWGVKPQ